MNISPGTNRFAIIVDGYVIKIAMDKDGIRDNWSEFSAAQELQPFVTKVYECNGLLIVAEYVTPLSSKDELAKYKSEMQGILSHLAMGYLLGDVGTVPKNYMNWGFRSDGELVILDFAYIYRVLGEEMICGGMDAEGNICEGILEYDANFHNLICPVCRKSYTFHDIRRKINRDYEQKELDAIKQIAYEAHSSIQEVDGVCENIDHTPENNQKGVKDMNFYDDKNDPNETEINIEDAFEDALDFVRSEFGNHSACDVSTETIFGPEDEVRTTPVICNMNIIDDTADKIVDVLGGGVVEDGSDEYTPEEILDIINYNSEIEDKNDILEYETGISDETLEAVGDAESLPEDKDEPDADELYTHELETEYREDEVISVPDDTCEASKAMPTLESEEEYEYGYPPEVIETFKDELSTELNKRMDDMDLEAIVNTNPTPIDEEIPVEEDVQSESIVIETKVTTTETTTQIEIGEHHEPDAPVEKATFKSDDILILSNENNDTVEQMRQSLLDDDDSEEEYVDDEFESEYDKIIAEQRKAKYGK